MKAILLNWSPENKSLLAPFIELHKKQVIFTIVWYKKKTIYHVESGIKQVFFFRL